MAPCIYLWLCLHFSLNKAIYLSISRTFGSVLKEEEEDVDFFFERVTTKKIPSFSSLHKQQTFHKYYQRIFGMFKRPRKDLQHANLQSLVVSKPPN